MSLILISQNVVKDYNCNIIVGILYIISLILISLYKLIVDILRKILDNDT